ncbi:MAG: hypothetical protein JNK23_00055 [Opitutaceae bacterium]|nr:hypothetical protein [Opitutaceae bacterium]
MPRPPLRLGKSGTFLFVLLMVGVGFVGGSALFDALFIRYPTEAQIGEGIAPSVPESYRRFALTQVTTAATTAGVAERRSATLTFQPRAPLFKPADFQSSAVARGDDPAAFADALARHTKLDARTAPPVPAELPPPALHAHAPPAESLFSVNVSYQTQKTERTWPLVACWQIWRGLRTWIFSEATWPDPPASVAGLRERSELRFNAAVLGEPAAEEWLRNYVARRQAFIKAVNERETRTVDQAIDATVRQTFGSQFSPTDTFRIKAVTPRGAPAVPRTEATVVIEQLADLFRLAPDAAAPTTDAQREAMARAEKLAKEFLSDPALVVPVVTRTYELASPAGTTLTGTVTFEVRASAAEVATIENLRWTQEPAWPAGPVVREADTEPKAIFLSGGPRLRTPERYAAEVEAYVQRVNQAIAAMETRWGEDRDAWRMALRALVAHGGRERIRMQTALTEEVSGSRVATDAKEIPFRGSRQTLFPFRQREDFSFTGEKVVGRQIEALNERGFWRTSDGKMGPNDLTNVGHTAFQRRMAYARGILWHLAAESVPVQRLTRGQEPHTLTVAAPEPDLPDLTVTFDSATGLLTSVRYEDRAAAKTTSFEVRYAEFKETAGVVRPTKVVTLFDGKTKDAFSVTAWILSPDLAAENFRNPYSPGRPFQSATGAAGHAVNVVNSTMIGTPILVCFDDDPDTVALGSKTNRTITLPEGDHEFTIVAWVPQISLRQPHRIETISARVRIRSAGVLNIDVDSNARQPIRWAWR